LETQQHLEVVGAVDCLAVHPAVDPIHSQLLQAVVVQEQEACLGTLAAAAIHQIPSAELGTDLQVSLEAETRATLAHHHLHLHQATHQRHQRPICSATQAAQAVALG
jgi:hypothetical protein